MSNDYLSNNLDSSSIPDICWIEYKTLKNENDKRIVSSNYYNTLTKKYVLEVPNEYMSWRYEAMDKYLKNSSWKRFVKPSNNKVYYYNKEEKKTQWDEPEIVIEFDKLLHDLTLKRLERDEQIEKFLSTTNWRRVKKSDNRCYYYDVTDKKPQWDVPEIVSNFISNLENTLLNKVHLDNLNQPMTENLNEPKTIKRKAAEIKNFDENDEMSNKITVTESSRLIDTSNTIEMKNVDNEGAKELEEEEEEENYYDEEYEGDHYNFDDANQEESNKTPQESDDGTPQESDDGTPQESDDNNEEQGFGNDDHEEQRFDSLDESSVKVDNSIELAELQRLHDLLSVKDAIMNPNAFSLTQEAINISKSMNVPADDTIKILSNSYCGYAQMTHIILEWLTLAQKISDINSDDSLKNSSSNETKKSSARVLYDAETEVLSQLSSMIKQRFDKDKADSLIEEFSKGSLSDEWLTGMMNDSTLRRVLIELYDQNRRSTLLGFSLRKISSMGFHREIAQIIREVDYFDVFNDLLVDMITQITQANGTDLMGFSEDLKRMCCHAEYIFLYANDLLVNVENLLLNDINENPVALSSFSSAINKKITNMELFGYDDDDDDDEGEEDKNSQSINNCLKYDGKSSVSWRCKVRRLRQELEEAAVWGKRDQQSHHLNNLATYALRLINTFSSAFNGNKNGHVKLIWSELLDLLKKDTASVVNLQRLYAHYMKIDIGADFDKLSPISESNLRNLSAPLSYLREPQVLRLFVDALLHPTKQLRNDVIAAKLLALSCNFNEALLLKNDCNVKEICSEIESVSQYLITARDICNEIPKMAYGIISFEKLEKLIELLTYPVISMSILQWIGYIITESFMSKQQNLTLLPVLFQIIITSSEYHPLQRPDCFKILRDILKLSSNPMDSFQSSQSYSIVEAQKDSIQSMIYLMGQGFVTIPMDFICSNIHDFDGAMVRHLLHLILNSIKPPFSKNFALKLLKLLLSNSSIKAIMSSHFTSSDITILKNIYEIMEEKKLIEYTDSLKFQELFNNLLLYHGNKQ